MLLTIAEMLRQDEEALHGQTWRTRCWSLLLLSIFVLLSLEKGDSFQYHRFSTRSLNKVHVVGIENQASWRTCRISVQSKSQLFQSSLQESSPKKTHGKVSIDRPKSTGRMLERQIVELGRQGLTDEALDLFHNITKPSLRQMNSAIDACARARPTRLKEAFQILESSAQTHNILPNVFSFGALMSACARARRGDEAQVLLKSMQANYNVKPNAVVFSSAITAVARSEPPQPEVALHLLQQATETHNLPMNVVGYNAALSACAKAGDWQRAIQLLEHMEGNCNQNVPTSVAAVPDHVTYGTVLAACENGEQWDLVLEHAKMMEARKLQLDTLALTSVLKACQQLGLSKEALYYLNKMKTQAAASYVRKTSGWKRQGAKRPLKGPDPVAYRLAISACARGGAWHEGLQLLSDFEKATGEPPDVVAYTAAITGCEYAGEWRKAFGLLDRMRKSGIEPNEVTMTAIMGACATACAKENNGIAFRQTLATPMPLPQHKALQLLKILKEDDNLVNPNVNVYNAAIRACAEACDLKRALLLLKDLLNEGLKPTIVTFGTLMTASERAESMEGANIVFKSMKEHGIEPNEIIYGAAISCCRKARESERAFLLLKKMVRDGLFPNVATFNTAIMAQIEGKNEKGCLDRGILIYKIMASKSHEVARPNRQTYNLLIRALTAVKKPREAEALLKKMAEAGYVPDVDLYAATVACYERRGQPLEALRLMESMREDGYDFYEVEVLNSAFKKAVKLANAVGRGFSTPSGATLLDEDKDVDLTLAGGDISS